MQSLLSAQQEPQFNPVNFKNTNSPYASLYSCKHFRNRVIRLQQLCLDQQVDAIVLITGKT